MLDLPSRNVVSLSVETVFLAPPGPVTGTKQTPNCLWWET